MRETRYRKLKPGLSLNQPTWPSRTPSLMSLQKLGVTGYDAVGRDTFLDSLRTLRPRGTLVMFGKASGDPPLLDPFLLAPKSLYVTWPGRTVLHRASRATGSCGCGPVRCNSARHPRCRPEPHLRARRHRHRSPRSGGPQDHRCRHHHSVSAGR